MPKIRRNIFQNIKNGVKIEHKKKRLSERGESKMEYIKEKLSLMLEGTKDYF